MTLTLDDLLKESASLQAELKREYESVIEYFQSISKEFPPEEQVIVEAFLAIMNTPDLDLLKLDDNQKTTIKKAMEIYERNSTAIQKIRELFNKLLLLVLRKNK